MPLLTEELQSDLLAVGCSHLTGDGEAEQLSGIQDVVGQSTVDAGRSIGKILFPIGLQSNLTGGKIGVRITPSIKVQCEIERVVIQLDSL